MPNKKEVLIFITLIFLFVNISISSATDNYDDVLLVTNDQSEISLQIGNYFAEQRNITHWLNISVEPDEITYYTTFNNSIRTPIENYIINNNLQNTINYIVTTKGVPLRHLKEPCEYGNASCASVDSELTLILGPYNTSIGVNDGRANPYYNQNEEFNHSKFGIYLVTRLDGYNWNEIKAMIDNATISDDNGNNKYTK